MKGVKTQRMGFYLYVVAGPNCNILNINFNSLSDPKQHSQIDIQTNELILKLLKINVGYIVTYSFFCKLL